jgi:hypothetical protein
MRTRFGTAAAAAALAALLVLVTTACSGGGRLSAREYVRRASDVCHDARVQGRHLARPGSATSARAAARAADLHTEAAQALADLRPPTRLAHFDAAWVALVRQAAAELDALSRSLAHHDRAAARQQADAVRQLTERAVVLGRAHGISACPTPFTPDPTPATANT